jgi:hypothetical protein
VRNKNYIQNFGGETGEWRRKWEDNIKIAGRG